MVPRSLVSSRTSASTRSISLMKPESFTVSSLVRLELWPILVPSSPFCLRLPICSSFVNPSLCYFSPPDRARIQAPRPPDSDCHDQSCEHVVLASRTHAAAPRDDGRTLRY